jgi:hypothetical protein
MTESKMKQLARLESLLEKTVNDEWGRC